MDTERLAEVAVTTAKKLNVDDAIALTVEFNDSLLRFANNSVTVANQTEETDLAVYLAKNRRKALASTSNLDEANVKRFVSDLFDSLRGLPETDYAPLPTRRGVYSPRRGFDKKVTEAGESLPELARVAIESSTKAGGKRTTGIIDASTVKYGILTSHGTSGSDERTSITLNVRAFGDGDSSGHGLSCSAGMKGFDAEEAGRRAGEDSKKMRGAVMPQGGLYEVLLSPTVASNLVETVVGAASAFAVEAGLSYLKDRFGTKVASDLLTVKDHGSVEGALGGRCFDDEGMPTKTTPIIESGVLSGYLHNLTTAMKWKTVTTGNAGIVSPHPWNIEVSHGDAMFDEMVKSMKNGVILTSNWYTRFKNYRTGEFSTVPRDGAYLVESGKITKPLKGMRVSDDLQRMFSSVKMLSKRREWIEWWEVDTPTLCPWMLVDGVSITRAYE